MGTPSDSTDAESAAKPVDGVGIVEGETYVAVTESLVDIHSTESSRTITGAEWRTFYTPLDPELSATRLLRRVRDVGRWRGAVQALSGTDDTVRVDLSLWATASRVVCVVREAEGNRDAGPEAARTDEPSRRDGATVLGPMGVLSEDGRVMDCTAGLVNVLGGEAEREVVGRDVHRFVHDADRAMVRRRLGRVMDESASLAPVQCRLVGVNRRERTAEIALVPFHVEGSSGALAVFREVRTGRGHKEVDTPSRIDGVLLTVVQDLCETASPEEIREMVCERVAAADHYPVAWIGTPEASGDSIVPRAAAGIDEATIDPIDVSGDGTTECGPVGSAFATGTIQVCRTVQAASGILPRTTAVGDHSVRSAAAVPLVHDETVYGVLVVYTDRGRGFTEHERRGLEALGTVVGLAISAWKMHKLLFADTIVELELEVGHPESVFVRLGRTCGCSLALTGCVSGPDDTWSVFLAADGASPRSLVELAETDPEVTAVEVISADADGGHVEVVLQGSGLNRIAEVGAKLTGGRIENGRAHLLVEAPLSSDTRTLVDRVRTACPRSTLVALHERDRSVRTSQELRQSVERCLTERQLEVLQRAYHRGYFQWPRTSNGGEVADSIGIAESTFHYHLRKALGKLLELSLKYDPDPAGSV